MYLYSGCTLSMYLRIYAVHTHTHTRTDRKENNIINQ